MSQKFTTVDTEAACSICCHNKLLMYALHLSDVFKFKHHGSVIRQDV
jgi:hypothetical protein